MLGRLYAAAVASILLASVASPGSAEVFDASTMTCQQMLDVASKKAETKADNDEQSRVGVLMMWMQGYLAPDSHGTAVDLKKVMSNIDRTVEMCQKSPNLGLMSVTEKLWDDDAELSKDAVDLSTVTCEAMLKADDTKRAVMLIWLLGYNSAVAKDSTFELDAMGEKVKGIAEYCVNNPTMGLVTASDKAEE